MILEDLDLNSIQDIEQARHAIIMLFNLLEDLKANNRKLQEEVQRLRDENNRLKGEQGKPDIKPNKRPGESAKPDHSSEAERRKPQERQKSSKLGSIHIDRVSGTLKIPSLANLINEQAKQYPLGLSWNSS